MMPREHDKATKAPSEASAAKQPYRAGADREAPLWSYQPPCASPALARCWARRRPLSFATPPFGASANSWCRRSPPRPT